MPSPIQYLSGTEWLDVTPVGNVSISYGIAGIGSSGLSTRSLHFECPAEWIDLPRRAAVRCADGYIYYVSGRSLSRYMAQFDCVDGTALLDQPVDLSNAAPSGQVVGADEGYIMDNSFVSAAEIASRIEGISGLGLSGFAAPESYGFKRITIEGMTYAELLIALSEIHGGFYAANGGSLYLTPMSGTASVAAISDEHSLVSMTGQYTLTNILVQGKKDTAHNTDYTLYPYTIFSTPDYNTLNISSAFSEFTDVTEFPVGATFTGWRCENSIGYLPALGSRVTFTEHPGTSFCVTDVSARLVGSSWLVSMGGGLPSGGSEIERRTRRQMETDKKVTANQSGLEKVTNSYGQTYYKAKEGTAGG